MAEPIEGHFQAGGIRFALLVTRWNSRITSLLLDGATDCLERHGAGPESRTVIRVPGSWELPLVAARAAASGRFDAIIALGALVRGETPHFDVLAAECAKGLASVSLESGIPVSFGVITADSPEQAEERAGGKAGNKGWDAALAAVETVGLLRRLS